MYRTSLPEREIVYNNPLKKSCLPFVRVNSLLSYFFNPLRLIKRTLSLSRRNLDPLLYKVMSLFKVFKGARCLI